MPLLLGYLFLTERGCARDIIFRLKFIKGIGDKVDLTKHQLKNFEYL